MQRYFFDFHDAERHTQDLIGIVYDNDEVAIKEALVALPQIMLFEDGTRTIVCDVRNGDGQVIYVAELMLRGRRVAGARVIA